MHYPYVRKSRVVSMRLSHAAGARKISSIHEKHKQSEDFKLDEPPIQWVLFFEQVKSSDYIFHGQSDFLRPFANCSAHIGTTGDLSFRRTV